MGVGTVNEPAIRTEEQIISLFPDKETLVCRGWVLKKMEGQLLLYPLYYIFSDGAIFTAVIRKIRRINPPEKRNRKWIYKTTNALKRKRILMLMKNVSW